MGDTLDQRGEVHYFTWEGPMRFFSNLPVIIFAFTCHQNVSLSKPHLTPLQVFTIANEIRDEKEMNGVIATSIGTAVSLYLLVAFTGYISYGTRPLKSELSM